MGRARRRSLAATAGRDLAHASGFRCRNRRPQPTPVGSGTAQPRQPPQSELTVIKMLNGLVFHSLRWWTPCVFRIAQPEVGQRRGAVTGLPIDYYYTHHLGHRTGRKPRLADPTSTTRPTPATPRASSRHRKPTPNPSPTSRPVILTAPLLPN